MKNRRPSSGMVLYIVAVVLVLLVLGAFALSSLLTVEHEATLLRGDEIQVAQIARSGIDYVAALIALTVPGSTAGSTAGSTDRTTAAFIDPFAEIDIDPFAPEPSEPQPVAAQDLYDNPERLAAVPVVPARPDKPNLGTGRFTIIAPRLEENRIVGIRYGLVNESTRLHLGTVLAWEKESPGQGARSLMKLPGMTPSTADSILDWIDADGQPRPSGAEVGYYERAGFPYGPRNALPISLEELLLVRDVDRRLVFGGDETFTYGYRRTGERRALGETPPWSHLLTTLSAEKLVDPATGLGKIDLNDDNPEFLHEQLEKRFDRTVADFVVGYRDGLTGDGSPGNESPGNDSPGNDSPGNGSPQKPRRIDCPLDLLDGGIVDRNGTVLASPFALDKGEAEERFLSLLDAATEERRIIVPGRVNVNEASRSVLEAIPGLSEQAVSAILARRGRFGETRDKRFRHPCWLLSEGILDRETLRTLWPRITTGGDVWRTQIVAFYDGKGPGSRLEVVLDGTVKPPKQVFLKDLTLYGIGYPDSVLMGRRDGYQ